MQCRTIEELPFHGNYETQFRMEAFNLFNNTNFQNNAQLNVNLTTLGKLLPPTLRGLCGSLLDLSSKNFSYELLQGTERAAFLNNDSI
jgi:hypothetical protein